MFQLPPIERYLFWGMLAFSILGAVAGLMFMSGGRDKFRRLIMASIAIIILFGAVLLGFRASTIKTFPMSNIFESMIILLIFVGVVFLFLSVSIRQPWFHLVMSWVFLLMILLSMIVARPVSLLPEAAQTPWIAVHALSMAFSGATILFSAATSMLFLLSFKRLKNKQFPALFGKMPSIEKLETLTLTGLRLSFLSLSFGLVSGIAMAVVKSAGLGMTLTDWLTDSKIVMITAAWALMLALLLLRKILALSGTVIAKMTLLICFFIIFAFIGSQVLCKSVHDFGSSQIKSRQDR